MKMRALSPEYSILGDVAKEPNPPEWWVQIWHTAFASRDEQRSVATSNASEREIAETAQFTGVKIRPIAIPLEEAGDEDAALERAYFLGQNDFEPRECVRRVAPSASVGDVIRLYRMSAAGSYAHAGDWRIEMLGFRPLGEDESITELLGSRARDAGYGLADAIDG